MKYLVVLSCVMVGVLAADKYTDKYDGIDIEEILGNDRFLTAYTECVMGRGKCTPEGTELKKNLVEAIETGCAKCTAKQEDGATTIIDHLIKFKPEIWHELTAMFDPTGKWRKEYEERARAKGIIIPSD